MITQVQHNSTLYSNHGTKARVFYDFFSKLMGSEAPPTPHIHWQNLYPDIIDLINLVDPISKLEILMAIQQWSNSKSPGPEGFSGEFYKNFVDMISVDLLATFWHVMDTQTDLHPLNSSYIALIPKKKSPQLPDDFRPISLLHRIQKIFSKLLTNRLQSYMHLIIGDAQTGFQKNRHITESYIYAQYVLHMAKNGKTPLGLLKLDSRKAFDMVSWTFVVQVMSSLGFLAEWITWVKNSILQDSSQVIINGLLGKRIKLRRGVRQGDLLSPNLFIIAMDFITRYLQKLTSTGAIRLPYPQMWPCLLYADDALLVFSEVSGISINLQK